MNRLNSLIVAGCLTIFGTPLLANAAALECSGLFVNHSDVEATTGQAATASRLWPLLNKTTVNGSGIVDVLSLDPYLKHLFDGWNEGTNSIRQHTLMVFDVFAEQFPIYQAHYRFKAPPDVRLFQTLKFVIALHDIGKPLAIEAGSRSRQHEFTDPILTKALAHFGFSVNETKLAKALVGNTVMGDLIRGYIDIPTAKTQLSQIARKAGMSLADYAPLQFLFYTVDAGSYPQLRHSVFIVGDDGLMTPDRPQFDQFRNLIVDKTLRP